MNPIIEEVKEFDSSDFETLKYNLVNESDDILLDNACDPDLNLSTSMLKILTQSIFRQTISKILEKNL